jgi:dTDP-glucose 4,6-dehydratase
MAEKFLVVGASSFYGSSFCDYLETKGVEVYKASLRDWVPGRLLECEPDYVVNFAAANIVAESWDKTTEYINCNVRDHTTLFRVLSESKIKKYVHVSTPESYGSTEGWVDETYATWSPSTPYAVTRAAGDMMAMAYHRAFKLPVVITRTANIYGPKQPDHRLIPFAIKKLKNGESVPLHGGGNSLRCFVHIKDACAATYLAATQGSAGQTYHISSETPVTVANVVHRLCEFLYNRS